MKNLIIYLLMIAAQFAVSQNLEGSAYEQDTETQLKDFKMSVVVDSEADLNKTFTMNDLDQLINRVSEDQSVSFELTCKTTANKASKSISYKIEGNASDIESFREGVVKIRKAAVKYFKNN
ncbi:MAG: hypothetical protein ACWA5P_04280 [bacterium]